jgi:hypothetical protein
MFHVKHCAASSHGGMRAILTCRRENRGLRSENRRLLPRAPRRSAVFSRALLNLGRSKFREFCAKRAATALSFRLARRTCIAAILKIGGLYQNPWPDFQRLLGAARSCVGARRDRAAGTQAASAAFA